VQRPFKKGRKNHASGETDRRPKYKRFDGEHNLKMPVMRKAMCHNFMEKAINFLLQVGRIRADFFHLCNLRIKPDC
jgi:hypothetical protein